MKRVMMGLVMAMALCIAAGPLWAADDTPAPPQLPGEHSTIVTSDGSIRDDELADYIAEQVAGKDVSDVKVFFQGCYGGGFLDDIERAMDDVEGADGTEIPWVAGSAANGNEPAWTGEGNGGTGSFWTDAFGDSMGTTGSVAGDIGATNAADAAAPGNPMADGEPEHPQGASGNGGGNITWGSQAQVVVFAGNPNTTSIENDVSNMEDDFNDQYNADPDSTIYTSATGSRSTQNLKDMIRDACNGLQGGQLVLYFGDHGDTEFDLDEFWDWFTEGQAGGFIPLDSGAGWGTAFDLHDGWVTGLEWMNEKTDEDAEPTFDITPVGELLAADWQLFLNGVEIPLVDIAPGDNASVPVPWDIIQAGPNVIELLPTLPGAPPPLELENLELASGPIALRLRPDVIPEPAGLGLVGIVLLAALRRRRS